VTAEEYGMFSTALTEVYRLTTGRLEIEDEITHAYFGYLEKQPLRDVVEALQAFLDLGADRFPKAPEILSQMFTLRRREQDRDRARMLTWDRGGGLTRERREAIWREAMITTKHYPDGAFSREMFAMIERVWASEDRRKAERGGSCGG